MSFLVAIYLLGFLITLMYSYVGFEIIDGQGAAAKNLLGIIITALFWPISIIIGLISVVFTFFKLMLT